MKINTKDLFSQETLFKNKSTPSLRIINIDKNNKISKLSFNTNNSTTFTSKYLY